MPSIFQRRGRAGVTLKYVDASGRARMRQFPTEDAAAAWLKELEQRARLARDPDQLTTLDVYAERWFNQVKTSIAPGTAELYAWAFNQHINPAIGKKPLAAVTRIHVKDLLAAKLGELAKNTVRNLRTALRACLAEAVNDGLIPSNPAAGRLARSVDLGVTRSERLERVKAFTGPELQLLLGACRTAVPHRFPVFRFMAGTGVRPGEAIAVKWEDLDIEGRSAMIRRSWWKGTVRPRTKTGRARRVVLGAGLVDELRAWDVETKARALASGRPRPEWVFPDRNGNPIDLRRLERSFKKVLAAAGLPPWHSPHHLRHTYATLALRKASLRYVQEQLGHSSIALTVDLYGSWMAVGDSATADQVERETLPGPVTSDVTSDARKG